MAADNQAETLWTAGDAEGDSMEDVVGFIGLGTMGGPMVGQLSKAGRPAVVYDAHPAALQAAVKLPGVEAAASPREVAERCAEGMSVVECVQLIP